MRGYYEDATPDAVVREARKADAERICSLCDDSWLVELELDELPMAVDPGAEHYTVELKRDGEPKIHKYWSRLTQSGELQNSFAALDVRGRKRWRLTWRGYARSAEDAGRSAVEMRRAILAGELAPDERGRLPVSLDAVSPDWKATDGG
jgi:hypothetical protein